MKNTPSVLSLNQDKTSRSRNTSKEEIRKKNSITQKDSRLQKFRNEENQKDSDLLKDHTQDFDTKLFISQNYSTASKVAKLQETGLLYAKKIEVETKRLKELDAEIQIIQEAIKIKRMELVDIEGNDADTYFKEIRKLEVQLEKVLGENHEVSSRNRQLKEEINMLRQERVVLNHIFHQLEVELITKEGELDAVIQQTDKVKQEKQKAQDQIDSLKRVVMQEQKKIEDEYKQYIEVLNNEDIVNKRSVLEFHDVDNQENKILLTDESHIMQSKGTNSPMRDITHDTSPKATKSRDNHSKSKYASDLAKLQKTKKEVEKYENVLEVLRKRTGLHDINQIVELFNQYEQENQSLFQFANEITQEKEMLEKKFLDLKKEMEYYVNHDDPIQGDNPRAQSLLTLNKKIEEQDHKHKQLKKRYDDFQKTIDAIKFTLPIMLQKIGYQDNSDIKQIIENDELNEMNLLLCLGYLENKTDEILQAHDIMQNKEDSPHKKKFLENLFKKSILNEDSYYTTNSCAKNTTINNGNQLDQNNMLLKDFTTLLEQHTKEINSRDAEKKVDFDEYRGLIKKELNDFYKAKDIQPRESRKLLKKHGKFQIKERNRKCKSTN